MYIYRLEEKTFKKIIKNNDYVLVGVYKRDCVISNLFKGAFEKIKNSISNEFKICLLENEEYLKIFDEKNVVLPKIMLYVNQKLCSEIVGFKNYNSILDVVNQKLQ